MTNPEIIEQDELLTESTPPSTDEVAIDNAEEHGVDPVPPADRVPQTPGGFFHE